MKPIDEVILVRFASAEMSTAEEVEFLARCELEPELWRASALALVEHRQFVAALREFADAEVAQPAEPARLSGGPSNRRWPSAVMVAASVFAIFLGGLSGTFLVSHYRSDVGQVHQSSSAGASEDSDTSVFVCLQPPSGQAHPTPAADEDLASAAEINTRPMFSEEARCILQEVGVEVAEERVLYFLDGQDGERWAVPTTDFTLALYESP